MRCSQTGRRRKQDKSEINEGSGPRVIFHLRVRCALKALLSLPRLALLRTFQLEVAPLDFVSAEKKPSTADKSCVRDQVATSLPSLTVATCLARIQMAQNQRYLCYCSVLCYSVVANESSVYTFKIGHCCPLGLKINCTVLIMEVV